MTSSIIIPSNNEEDESFDCAMQLATSFIVPVVMTAAIQLGLFDIIAKAGEISPSNLASHLPTQNKDASAMLDRMLKLLVTHSILTCSSSNTEGGADEQVEILYSLSLIGKHFTGGRPYSLTNYFTFSQNSETHDIGCKLRDAILDGRGITVTERDLGMSFYKYFEVNPESSKQFNMAMSEQSNIVMTKILNKYKGFQGIDSLVDVGGGVGTTLHLIISKYPSIQAINFDLPHVIQNAPIQNGIQHIGGDMFVTIPKCDAVLLRLVCHNWDDEHCLRLLKNCYKALPQKGKVIIVDHLITVLPNTSISGKYISQTDNIMLCVFGSKERTFNQIEALSKAAGFANIQILCSICSVSVLEILK